MIFPLRSEPAPVLQRLSPRSDTGAGFALPAPVKPVETILLRRRSYPRANFSAQLLALGLRYGMDDLVNKADTNASVHAAEDAVRSYAQVQEKYSYDDRPALFARWSA